MDNFQIPKAVTGYPPRRHAELGLLDNSQPQSMLRDHLPLALVVAATLLTTSYSGHGRPAVEERHCLRVLLLLELDHES